MQLGPPSTWCNKLVSQRWKNSVPQPVRECHASRKDQISMNHWFKCKLFNKNSLTNYHRFIFYMYQKRLALILSNCLFSPSGRWTPLTSSFILSRYPIMLFIYLLSVMSGLPDRYSSIKAFWLPDTISSS